MTSNIHSNPKEVRLSKVVLNFGIGAEEHKQTLVLRFLEMILPGRKVLVSRSRQTNKEFGIKKGQVVGLHLTIRGKQAETVLRRIIASRKIVPMYSITNEGNVSFGIQNVNYIPEIDIQSSERIGADVSVSFRRIGEKIKYRRRARSKIPKHHYPSKEEVRDMILELGVRCE